MIAAARELSKKGTDWSVSGLDLRYMVLSSEVPGDRH